MTERKFEETVVALAVMGLTGLLLLLPCVLLSCAPPPQVRYPTSGATGVVCRSCYTGDRCQPELYPADQVDTALQLVADGAVNEGLLSTELADQALRRLHVCLVASALQRGKGTSWCHAPCTTLETPGSCLAGCAGLETAKVATVDMQGRALPAWRSALAHEILHALVITATNGWGELLPEGDLRFEVIVTATNYELQRRFDPTKAVPPE